MGWGFELVVVGEGVRGRTDDLGLEVVVFVGVERHCCGLSAWCQLCVEGSE